MIIIQKTKDGIKKALQKIFKKFDVLKCISKKNLEKTVFILLLSFIEQFYRS